jgi:septin family protein
MLSIGVVNRGDSFRRRRSRSNSLAPADQENEERRAPPKEVISYTVAMLGARGVGKTALISQFMTSECINAYDRQRGGSPEDSIYSARRDRRAFDERDWNKTLLQQD